MAEAAQLRADNFILPDFFRCEVNGNHQPGHGALLQAQLAHEDIVNHVLRCYVQLYLPIHRHSERGHDDVVLPCRIVRIDAERIARGGADLFWIEPAKFSVGTGIAEVEDELILRHLHLYGISSRGREADFRPGAASQNAEAEEQNDRGGGPDEFHGVVATRKVSALAVVAE